jgi:hypothetical protein
VWNYHPQFSIRKFERYFWFLFARSIYYSWQFQVNIFSEHLLCTWKESEHMQYTYKMILWRVHVTTAVIETHFRRSCQQYRSQQCCHGNTTIGFLCTVVEVQNISYYCWWYQRVGGTIILNWFFTKCHDKAWTWLYGSGQRQVSDCCECGNGPSRSIK